MCAPGLGKERLLHFIGSAVVSVRRGVSSEKGIFATFVDPGSTQSVVHWARRYQYVDNCLRRDFELDITIEPLTVHESELVWGGKGQIRYREPLMYVVGACTFVRVCPPRLMCMLVCRVCQVQRWHVTGA